LKDDDTEAEDVRRHGSTASFNGPVKDAPRITRGRHKSMVAGAGEVADPEDSTWKYVPVDFDEVRCRLQAGKYSSIVRTVFLMFLLSILLLLPPYYGYYTGQPAVTVTPS